MIESLAPQPGKLSQFLRIVGIAPMERRAPEK
jgi:hypothetical protein